MSTTAPTDPNALRPLLHERIDQWAVDDLPLLHRVMLELERDRLVAGLNAEFDHDREAGRLARLPEIIREARAALGAPSAHAGVIIVLDTNALVQVFGARSPFLPLQQAILDGRVALAFSTAILLEYEEVFTRYGGPERWPRVWQALHLTGQLHDNLRHVEPSYHWRLVSADPDDDKFADCAIAAEAEWIVTEDGHLDVLKHPGHKPQPITPEAFIREVLAKL